MYTRECPKCNKTIEYKSYGGWHTSTKNNRKCKQCANLESDFVKRFATKGKNCGIENPFYGKKHTEETKK